MVEAIEMTVPIGGGRRDLRSLLRSHLLSSVSSYHNFWLDDLDDDEYADLMRLQMGNDFSYDDLPFTDDDVSKGKRDKRSKSKSKFIDFDPQDDTECVYATLDGTFSNGKKNKRKRHKVDSSIERTNHLLMEDEDDSDSRLIYFYTDYNDKSSCCRFLTLSSFDSFCSENGFEVPDYVGEDLVYCSESHCCLNPVSREYGKFEIMRCDSYEDLKYEVGEYALYSSY